ncbi:tetratricopeptide repeat protein [Treponema sp.]
MSNKVRLPLVLFLSALSLMVYAQERRDALREYRLGNYQAAVDICRFELENTPENMDSYVVLCWSLVKLSQYDQASTAALKGRELNRYDPRIIEVLGEIRYFQGKNNEALNLFQEYITLAPEGGRIDVVYYYMGELFLRMGKFKHADIALSTAVRYVPTDALWWTRLGYARENAADYRYAIAAYDRAIVLNPQSQDALRGLERTRRKLPSR